MLTPDGVVADDIDKVMLMAMWANECDQKAKDGRPPVIFAAMGKPTFPIHQKAVQACVDYWNKVNSNSQNARHYLSLSPKRKQSMSKRDLIVNAKGPVSYSNSQGVLSARQKMAVALNRWYDLENIFKPEHILFTVGDVGALHNVFEFLHYHYPKGRIVTPFPHYALYAGVEGRKNFLHPIDVMQQKGYKLTAKALQQSIEEAKQAAQIDGSNISAFLFCDPNNPLGTVVDTNEWYEIAKILRNEPNTLIILDEAYAEMQLNGRKNTSLVQIAPDLRHRIVLMRSATKGLSAAGERMAVAVAFDKFILKELLKFNISIVGHAPESLQHGFAEAMGALDEIEHENIIEFYKPQVEFVAEQLKDMAAAMPDLDYKVEGTFYVLADLSDLLGQRLKPSAKNALGQNHNGIIITDEDIAYHLLFKNNILISPLSYFGVDPKLGYLRITCSGGDTELLLLCTELVKALHEARTNKYLSYLHECNTWLKQISDLNEQCANLFKQQVAIFTDKIDSLPNKTAKQLKDENTQLSNLLIDIKQEFSKLIGQDTLLSSNITTIQALFSSKLTKDQYQFTKQTLGLNKIKQWSIIKRAALEQEEKYFINQVMNNKTELNFWTPFHHDMKQNSEKIEPLQDGTGSTLPPMLENTAPLSPAKDGHKKLKVNPCNLYGKDNKQAKKRLASLSNEPALNSKRVKN